MNAVIVDIRKKHAAALDENGRIVRIRSNHYEIGQQIELHEVKPISTAKVLRRFGSGVAAAVLIAVIGTGTAYALPYGTVTLEGERSVKYTINCFDYVLDVQAVNEEGEALLDEIDLRQLRHHRIDRAVSVTMKQIDRSGYPENTKAPVQISADTRNERHTERLQKELGPMFEKPKPPVSPDAEINSQAPVNNRDSYSPGNPSGEAPQDELPEDPNHGSQHPGNPFAGNEQESSVPLSEGEDIEVHLPSDGFPEHMPPDGHGMNPGIYGQASVNIIPGQENRRPAF